MAQEVVDLQLHLQHSNVMIVPWVSGVLFEEQPPQFHAITS